MMAPEEFFWSIASDWWIFAFNLTPFCLLFILFLPVWILFRIRIRNSLTWGVHQPCPCHWPAEFTSPVTDQRFPPALSLSLTCGVHQPRHWPEESTSPVPVTDLRSPPALSPSLTSSTTFRLSPIRFRRPIIFWGKVTIWKSDERKGKWQALRFVLTWKVQNIQKYIFVFLNLSLYFSMQVRFLLTAQ